MAAAAAKRPNGAGSKRKAEKQATAPVARRKIHKLGSVESDAARAEHLEKRRRDSDLLTRAMLWSDNDSDVIEYMMSGWDATIPDTPASVRMAIRSLRQRYITRNTEWAKVVPAWHRFLTDLQITDHPVTHPTWIQMFLCIGTNRADISTTAYSFELSLLYRLFVALGGDINTRVYLARRQSNTSDDDPKYVANDTYLEKDWAIDTTSPVVCTAPSVGRGGRSAFAALFAARFIHIDWLAGYVGYTRSGTIASTIANEFCRNMHDELSERKIANSQITIYGQFVRIVGERAFCHHWPDGWSALHTTLLRTADVTTALQPLDQAEHLSEPLLDVDGCPQPYYMTSDGYDAYNTVIRTNYDNNRAFARQINEKRLAYRKALPYSLPRDCLANIPALWLIVISYVF